MSASPLSARKPWSRIKRKPVAGGGVGARPAGEPRGSVPEWVCLLANREGREHPISPVTRLGWPQGCDQCHQLIQPAACQGAHSFSVLRGRAPTTLYLCAGCVTALCAAGAIPAPAQPPAG